VILYKYSGELGTKILDDLKVKVTPPNELNDPFELSPALDGKADQVVKAVREHRLEGVGAKRVKILVRAWREERPLG
jgi:hypothetical protein